MLNKRYLFLEHVAQTNTMPLMLEVDRAEGVYIYDSAGNRYFDLNSGICVSSVGHRHPKVVEAIKKQLEKHLHTMVYGEHIQKPQVSCATLLAENLPDTLQSIYFLMSGTEAVEGAMKLSKRFTGRANIVTCRNAYHGSTQGAESLRSDESYKRAFYPLLPGIRFIDFNNKEGLEKIDSSTACIILEPVQAEAGVIVPKNEFLKKVRARCDETGTLMVLDEIQTGFGRTGSLFAFQKYGIIPDILLVGKAMGGGMPISAFISSKNIMNNLTKNPALGHITTFGGHPISCSAARATLKIILDEGLVNEVEAKANFFKALLSHTIVHEIRNSGLMMAVELKRRKYLKHVVNYCFEHGVIIDYFLFNNRSFRLAPPLNISMPEIEEACSIISQGLDYANNKYIR